MNNLTIIPTPRWHMLRDDILYRAGRIAIGTAVLGGGFLLWLGGCALAGWL